MKCFIVNRVIENNIYILVNIIISNLIYLFQKSKQEL